MSIDPFFRGSNVSIVSRLPADAYTGKVVMVTGAAGSIGSELCSQLIQSAVSKLILLDQNESGLFNLHQELMSRIKVEELLEIVLCDIRDSASAEYAIARLRPDFIFHAAAYKHVPIVENYPLEAINTNIFGTRRIADLADKYDVQKLILISTDKALNPTSIMGATKRAAEIYIQSLNHRSKTNFITTRFGNVLGSAGSVVNLFRKQIERGGPVKVTHPEMTRYFMTIEEACMLVQEAGVFGGGGEVFWFDMGEPIKILDLARQMIEFYGTDDQQVEIIFSGTRPGEKIHEEPLALNVEAEPTDNPKIKVTRIHDYDYGAVEPLLASMALSMRNHEEVEAVRFLKELVPEFRSQRSRFEALDH